MILSLQQQFQACIELNSAYQFVANYKELTLSSVFQPIFNRQDGIIGVEALVRIKTAQGMQIRPDAYFQSNAINLEDKINVERLSRAIHIRNFSRSKYAHLKLFLNVLPSATEYLTYNGLDNSLLIKRLNDLNIQHSQLVMELVELKFHDDDTLRETMMKLSDQGFHVAVDDYGTKASTKERVELIQPAIVKLDRSIMLDFLDAKPEKLYEGLRVAKSIGAKVVVEGIETKHQYDTMKQLDIDMFQGYYLAMPEALSPYESITSLN